MFNRGQNNHNKLSARVETMDFNNTIICTGSDLTIFDIKTIVATAIDKDDWTIVNISA